MLKGTNVLPDFCHEQDFGNQLYFVANETDADELEIKLIEAYKTLKSDYEKFHVLSYDLAHDAAIKCMNDLNYALRNNMRISNNKDATHYVVIINAVGNEIYDQLKDLIDAISSIGMGLGITAVLITENYASDVFEANSTMHDLR